MSENARHVAVIVGGAVSGSVAAEILAQAGCLVVVVEQNSRPYGKIEDGLPRWHKKQRQQEYEKIDGRLGSDAVLFLPKTELGKDLQFEEILGDWRPSVVLLANGAWKDRPLDVEGADEYLDKGLIYQNPFIYWYNHFLEKAYDGPRYEVVDNMAVIGGGLASIDVVKAIQLELYLAAFRQRGIEIDSIHMEHKGIPFCCEEHGLKPEELGIEGCMLYYRRRVLDMPLAFPPDNATPEQEKKIEGVRKKMLEKCMEKYLFRFQDQTLGQGLVVGDGRLVGLRMGRTVVDGRKATPVPGSECDARHPAFIASIGSIPVPLPGVPQKGAWYDWEDWNLGKMRGYPTVYGIGNVVTGKGNIRDSLEHGKKVATHLVEAYLGISETRDFSEGMSRAEEGPARVAGEVAARVRAVDPLPGDRVESIRARVRERWGKLGYDGYRRWIEKVTPLDLE